jgi:hypothetical protein
VISHSDRSQVWLAVIAVVVASTSLVGCGRKAGLDPPPVASIVEPPPVASVVEPPPEAAQAQAGPTQSQAPATQPQGAAAQAQAPATQPPRGSMFGPDGKPIAPKTGEKKWFFLDWLID